MELNNFSDKSHELYSWFPRDVYEKAEKIVALPDLNPGKAPLPTGSAISFDLGEMNLV
jgi:hypothetical protein